MNKSEAVTPTRLSPISIALIVVALFIAVTFSVVPEITKPLMLKYYRTMYSTEVVRAS